MLFMQYFAVLAMEMAIFEDIHLRGKASKVHLLLAARTGKCVLIILWDKSFAVMALHIIIRLFLVIIDLKVIGVSYVIYLLLVSHPNIYVFSSLWSILNLSEGLTANRAFVFTLLGPWLNALFAEFVFANFKGGCLIIVKFAKTNRAAGLFFLFGI